MADTLQLQIDQLQQALHDLAVSLDYARRFQPAAVAGLEAQFATVKAQVDALVAKAQASETPNQATMAVGSIFDTVGSVIQTTVKAVNDTVSGIGGSLKILPVLLIGAVVVLGFLAYKGKLKIPGLS